MSWTLNHKPISTSSTHPRGARRKIHVPRPGDLESKPRDSNAPYNSNACRRCNYPMTSWGPTPVPVDKDISQTAKHQTFSPELLRSFWPEFYQPPTKLAEMTSEDTAIWVEMLGKFKGWEEAKTYANSFKTNDVTGYVLPYLSAHALRSELQIVKFGHRLEIMSAIENSELTLINPSIVSLRPSEFFKQFAMNKEISNCKSTTPSCAPLRNPWETSKKKAREVNKWLPGNSKSQWHSMKPTNFNEMNSAALYQGTDWISDPDLYGLRMFEETASWNLKHDSYSRMIRAVGTNRVKNYRSNVSKSSYNYPWIPTMELPPSMMNFDETESEDERLSTFFPDRKSTSSCGRQAQDNSWGGIGPMDKFKLEIQ